MKYWTDELDDADLEAMARDRRAWLVATHPHPQDPEHIDPDDLDDNE